MFPHRITLLFLLGLILSWNCGSPKQTQSPVVGTVSPAAYVSILPEVKKSFARRDFDRGIGIVDSFLNELSASPHDTTHWAYIDLLRYRGKLLYGKFDFLSAESHYLRALRRLEGHPTLQSGDSL